jgi:hypothetical protein
MRLNTNDIRQIFISNIRDNIPTSRRKCPSPNEMLRFFRSKKLDKKKTRIIDHVTKCNDCAHEFEFVLKALRFENDMNNVAEKLIASKVSERQLPRISWRFGLVTGMILIVCTMTTVLIISRTRINSKYRALSQSQIALFLPKSTSIKKPKLSFEWENIEDSEYYIFELYDEALYQIWKSGRLFGNNFTLPENIASGLKADKSYFWMISAFFPNGTNLESRLKEIFLID